jgi:hypothetical protein
MAHVHQFTTFDANYSRGAVNFNITGLRSGELIAPNNCASMQEALDMPVFNSDHIKLLVFQASRDEFAAKHANPDDILDEAAPGRKKGMKGKKDTIPIPPELDRQWHVSTLHHSPSPHILLMGVAGK